MIQNINLTITKQEFKYTMVNVLNVLLLELFENA